MFEIFGAAHAQPFHHCLRAAVFQAGEGDNFGQRQIVEGKAQHRPCGFTGVTLTPERPSQAPADFDAGRKR
ncbi:hypothetical protein SDC9_135335 [bioreactor metagenome]|uniref:Uncharacterized protein n=1 Tax=bioreactor metagenome TaxID=1076179 RepID=A0A645DFJ9_9ZZZZ